MGESVTTARHVTARPPSRMGAETGVKGPQRTRSSPPAWECVSTVTVSASSVAGSVAGAAAARHSKGAAARRLRRPNPASMRRADCSVQIGPTLSRRPSSSTMRPLGSASPSTFTMPPVLGRQPAQQGGSIVSRRCPAKFGPANHPRSLTVLPKRTEAVSSLIASQLRATLLPERSIMDVASPCCRWVAGRLLRVACRSDAPRPNLRRGHLACGVIGRSMPS